MVLSNLLKRYLKSSLLCVFLSYSFVFNFVQLTRFYLTFLISWIFAYLVELEGFIVLFFPPVMNTVAIVFLSLPHEHPRGGGGGLPKDGLVRFFHFVRSLFVNDPYISFVFVFNRSKKFIFFFLKIIVHFWSISFNKFSKIVRSIKSLV